MINRLSAESSFIRAAGGPSAFALPAGSVHRGGAFFVQDSARVNVTGCRFNQTGGNGVVLSNNVVDSAVTHSEFVRIGDSAIVALGSTSHGRVCH
jgi:hypothetical protein